MSVHADPPRLNIDERDIDASLGRLVAVLLDTVRELLERQAVRRFAAGSLTDEQAERLGNTLAAMRDRMTELKAAFAAEPRSGDDPAKSPDELVGPEIPSQIWRNTP